jgi:hypothetical protein
VSERKSCSPLKIEFVEHSFFVVNDNNNKLFQKRVREMRGRQVAVAAAAVLSL